MSNATQQPKERPILFSAPMVRAILEGRKTQTRRIIKPQPKIIHSIYGDASIDTERIFRQGDQRIHCPYGRPGDRLWVRETWAKQLDGNYIYRADFPNGYKADFTATGDWNPSIHMPRAAYRILLEITDIRSERVCDISEADAIAEGIEETPIWKGPGDVYPCNPIHEYSRLWQSINGPESWNINPWVWVITFNRITP